MFLWHILEDLLSAWNSNLIMKYIIMHIYIYINTISVKEETEIISIAQNLMKL